MITNAKERTERWLSKYNELNPQKRQYVSSQLEREYALQIKLDNTIRNVLSETTVPTSLNIPYLNFGRQIYGLAKRYKDVQLRKEIDIVMYKCLNRGLDKPVLEKILNAIQNLFLPPAPVPAKKEDIPSLL